MTTLVRLAGQPSRSSAVNSSGRYCGHGDEDDDKDYQEGVSRAMCGEEGRVAGSDVKCCASQDYLFAEGVGDGHVAAQRQQRRLAHNGGGELALLVGDHIRDQRMEAPQQVVEHQLALRHLTIIGEATGARVWC